jgi:phosphonate C-P lyase system protein PhnG
LQIEKLKCIQRIIPFLTDEEALAVIDFIKQKDFFIHREEAGMVMSGANDSFGNPFFLGELLVSEAEVEYKNKRGYGMVMGSNKSHALIMAASDSALQAGDDPFFTELDKYLEPVDKRMNESLNTEKKFVSGTKVNFGLMVEG